MADLTGDGLTGRGLAARVHALMPALQADLEALVAIPSVNLAGAPLTDVLRAGTAVLDLLRGAGLASARFIPISADPDRDAPLVYAEQPCDGAPTVLLYAHYDVQPAGPWEAAFRPRVVDGRLYGRGAADNKSGIAMHLGAIRALGGSPPVHLKVVIEGEEETGKGTLEAFAEDPANRDLFQADVIVVADVGNWAVGVPTLTTSLRGMLAVDVTIRTLRAPVHSGMYGGGAPDAFMALARMLAALHDEAGDVAVPGLARLPWDGVAMPEAQYRADAGVLAEVALMGTGSLAERLYARPAINVVGLDGVPAMAAATNALRDAVTARLSLRVVPGEDLHRAFALLAARLETLRPWGVELTITEAGGGEGYAADPSRPAYAHAEAALQAAYPGKQVQYAGQGASIPLVNRLAAINPAASIILWGAEDPAANIHGPAESVDLAELEAMTLAEAELLARLPALGPTPGRAAG